MKHHPLFRLFALTTFCGAFTLCVHAQAGSLDPTFGDNGLVISVPARAHAVLVQPDGRIVTAGYQEGLLPGTVAAFRLERYGSDGALDPSFGTDGVVILGVAPRAGFLWSLLQQPDGRLLVVGYTMALPGWNDMMGYVARLMPDGQLDASYGAAGIVHLSFPVWETSILDAALQPDGKLLVTGSRRMGQTMSTYTSRLNSDGTIDTGFGEDGIYTAYLSLLYQSAWCIATLPDGRFLVGAGAAEANLQFQLTLFRYLPNGLPDNTFGSGGGMDVPALPGYHVSNGGMRRLLVLPDGRIRAACQMANTGSTEARYALLGFNADGSLEEAFGTDGMLLIDFGPDAGVYDELGNAVLDPEGRITLVGGIYDSGQEWYQFGLARVLSNGALDPSFGEGGTALVDTEDGGWLLGAALQADGKLVAVGYNDIGMLTARLNSGPTSIAEVTQPISDITVTPNPVSDDFTLSFTNKDHLPVRMELMDASGRTVHRYPAQAPGIANPSVLALHWPANVVPGVYMLNIRSGAHAASIRVVR